MPPEAMGEVTTGESASGSERRLSPRFACEGFAEVFALETGFLFRGYMRDISQTGCFILSKAHSKLKRLAEVDVVFRLKGREYHNVARVMDVRAGKGVGLEFLAHHPELEESFMRLFHTLADEALRSKI